jgi:hypothetical protein
LDQIFNNLLKFTTFYMTRSILYFLFFCHTMANAQQLGDTLLIGNKKIVLSSNNLISNSGFENGFTGWKDGTAADLSTNNFTIINSGGINNSKYLVGTANAGNTSAGSISTGWSIEPQKTYYFSYHVKYQNTSTSAGPEIWLKTSLTNSSNLQEETFKLIDTSFVNGGGAWTKNAVAFTNSDSYSYLVARFRWLNNRFGFDNFALHEAKELRNTDALQALINQANTLYKPSSKRASDLLLEINKAKVLLNSSTVVEMNQGIVSLQNTIFLYQVANSTGAVPSVTTNPNFARGATMFFGRSSINANAQSIKEQGFCWSTNPEPTIFDNRTSNFLSNNGNIYYIENLTPSTVYYVRAYALTKENAVGYGDVLKVITIPKGTINYTLSSNVTGDNRTRIDKAMRSAVDYLNNLTSIQGHSLSVNFGSETPTAEASYGGWMRFGPNASYQQTGTALHEIAHTIGVGTHSLWSGPSSPLRATGSSGAWLGDRTTKLLQFLDNDPASYLRGDATHMWPYGVNGAQEDNGTKFLYVANALIVQALGEDGLPPTNGFATPAYTLKLQDDTKYYIKSEDEQTGLLTSFVVQDQNGNLVNRALSPNEVVMNDYAAWQLDFNPNNSYYTIKNVATGRYFTFSNTGNNGIGTIGKSSPGTNEFFQLIQSRVDATYKTITTRGYWIVHPEKNTTPPSFTASNSTSTSTSNFNLSNTSTKQRWLLLSEKDLENFGLISSIGANDWDSNNSDKSWIYVKDKVIHIENISFISDIKIVTLDGKLLSEEKDITSSYSKLLPDGLYLVVISSATSQVVQKILVR